MQRVLPPPPQERACFAKLKKSKVPSNFLSPSVFEKASCIALKF